MRPILLGVCAAFFFAFTFVLNHAMELSGGSWIWSASLRYFFMVPFLYVIVLVRKNLKPLLNEMRRHPISWLWWSTVGFGFFYAPICFATVYSPGWLVAGTWQITIISGTLLVPLFKEKVGNKTVRGRIPIKGLLMSLIILIGIILMQVELATQLSINNLLLGIIPVIIASFAYPLGNRKMMSICSGRLDAYQRVFGMTIASLPFWILLSVYGVTTIGPPKIDQTIQSGIVAVSSGVIATVLFFKATDIVRDDMAKLASVEATQSLEVIFALGGELIFLSIAVPSLISWIGILVVVIGMILHSLASHKQVENVNQTIPT